MVQAQCTGRLLPLPCLLRLHQVVLTVAMDHCFARTLLCALPRHLRDGGLQLVKLLYWCPLESSGLSFWRICKCFKASAGWRRRRSNVPKLCCVLCSSDSLTHYSEWQSTLSRHVFGRVHCTLTILNARTSRTWGASFSSQGHCLPFGSSSWGVEPASVGVFLVWALVSPPPPSDSGAGVFCIRWKCRQPSMASRCPQVNSTVRSLAPQVGKLGLLQLVLSWSRYRRVHRHRRFQAQSSFAPAGSVFNRPWRVASFSSQGHCLLFGSSSWRVEPAPVGAFLVSTLVSPPPPSDSGAGVFCIRWKCRQPCMASRHCQVKATVCSLAPQVGLLSLLQQVPSWFGHRRDRCRCRIQAQASFAPAGSVFNRPRRRGVVSQGTVCSLAPQVG